MKTILYVVIGGALGAVLRLFVNMLLKPEHGSDFPVHTFLINTVGCLAIGFAFAIVVKNSNTHALQYFIITGLLGGFTTFSSYTMEAVYLIDKGEQFKAIAYILLSNVCGIAAAWLGYNFSRFVTT